MMKYKFLIGGGILAMGLAAFLQNKMGGPQKVALPETIYEFKMKALDGKEVNFADFKGKKLLIVNTASKCGKTPQYADLQKLHEQHGEQVKVLGFPANNFLWQEPGSSVEIAEFCERNYGVTFQMFEKISVKGSDQHPLYQWLEAKTGQRPDWNFGKYVVEEDGKTVAFFKSGVTVFEAPILQKLVD